MLVSVAPLVLGHCLCSSGGVTIRRQCRDDQRNLPGFLGDASGDMDSNRVTNMSRCQNPNVTSFFILLDTCASYAINFPITSYDILWPCLIKTGYGSIFAKMSKDSWRKLLVLQCWVLHTLQIMILAYPRTVAVLHCEQNLWAPHCA